MPSSNPLAEVGRRAAGEHLREAQMLARQADADAAAGDAAAVAATLDRMQNTLQAWKRDIEVSHAAVVALQSRSEIPERNTTAWWEERSANVRAQFGVDPVGARREGVNVYVEALSAGELETCQRLAAVYVEAPEPIGGVAAEMALGALALQQAQLGTATRVYSQLLYAAWSPDELVMPEVAHRVTLMVLLGRIQLLRDRPLEARAHFEAARELAPRDVLALCGLADYWIVRQKHRRAESYYQEALEAQLLTATELNDPQRGDPYLGLANVAEQRTAWEEAEDWHRQAAAVTQQTRDPTRALGSLLAPASGAAFWRLAQALVEDRPEEAVMAAEAALDQDLSWAGRRPQGEVHLLRARALEAIQDDRTAAAYMTAGRVFMSDDRPAEAIDAMEKAMAAGSDDRTVLWDLADANRMNVEATDTSPAGKDFSKAQALWDKGYALVAPRVDEAWVYVARAAISEGRSEVPGDTAWRQRWEAVEYMERSILHRGGYAASAGRLARLFRQLHLSACALWTSERALEAGADDAAIVEHAASLANLGRFDECAVFLDELAASGGDYAAWARYLQATIDAGFGEARDGLRFFEEVIESNDSDLLARSMRALTLRRLGDFTRAELDYRFILEHRTSADLEDIAYGAYFLGERELARSTSRELLADRITDPDWALFLTGLVALTDDALDEGRHKCREAISKSAAPPDCDRFTRELQELNRRDATWTRSSELRSVVNELLEEASRHRESASLRAARTPPQEIDDALLEIPSDETGVRRAVSAVLVRWAAEMGDLELAAERYRAIDLGPWPLELGGLVDLCLQQATRLLRSADPAEACAHADRARAFLDEHGLDEPERHAVSLALATVAEMVRGQLDDAEQKVITGLARPDFRAPSFGRRFGASIRGVLESTDHFWTVDQLLEIVRATVPQLDETVGVAQAEVEGYVSTALGLRGTPTIQENRRPTVELGTGLIAADPGPSWVLFTTYVPDMRERIFAQTGIIASGVLFRRNEDLTPGGYRVLLDEVSHAQGEVPLDMHYVTVTAASDIAQTAQVLSARHPATKSWGYWIPAEPDAQTEFKDAEIWRDPLLFVVAHLEAVIRCHLGEHLSLDSLDGLLNLWGKAPADALAVVTCVPDRARRLKLLDVLRTLVSEQVPIVDGTIIMSALDEVGLDSTPSAELVEALRFHLRAQLPGNGAGWHVVELPPEVEAMLLEGAVSDLHGTLTPAPYQAMRALNAVRSVLDNVEEPAVVVVSETKLRSAVRRLLDSEFPDVPVLSAIERVRPGKLTAPMTSAELEL